MRKKQATNTLALLTLMPLLFLCGCIESSCRTFSNKTLYSIEKNPSKYIGTLYAFQGDVIQAQESNNEIVFQMLTKDYYSSYEYGPSLIVVFSRTDTPIIKGSWVKVLGHIGPKIEGYNAFGGSVDSLTMNAMAVSVDGRTYYFEKDKATIEQWQSGELFAPKTSEKPTKAVTLKRKKKQVVKNEVIGKWLEENPYLGRSRITIFGKDGKFFMENKYKDGSVGQKEMVEMNSKKGRVFQREEGGGDAGEFYLIDKQGNLQLWDEEGIIWTAKKID